MVVRPLYPIEIISLINSGTNKLNYFKSCSDIHDNGQGHNDGIYEIDVDGPDGDLEPFEVFCDMTNEGGGWTLFAHHRDGVPQINPQNLLDKSTLGVLSSDRWGALRNNMTTGMMFIDENGLISTISAAKLKSGNCRSVQNVSSLSPSSIKDKIWHNENSGCDGTGRDYSIIQILGQEYKNYQIAGASIYQQSSVKFDKWPYPTKFSSHEHQNALFYYIK